MRSYRQLIGATVLLGLTGVGLASAAVQDLTTSVKRVTVYRGWARVVRSSQVSLRAGTNGFVVRGLPAWVVADSAQGWADGGATVLSVRARRVPEDYDQQQALETAEKAVAQAKAGIERAKAEADALKAHLEYLGKLMPWELQKLPRESAERAVTAEELKKVNDYLAQARLETIEKRSEISLQLLGLETELRNCERERDRIKRKKTPDETTEILVDVSSAQAGQGTVSVSYLVAGASWYLEHGLTVGAGKTAALQTQGIVQQGAGEDWSGVEVVLSASHPLAQQTLPILSTWDVTLPSKKKGGPAVLVAGGTRTEGAYDVELVEAHRLWEAYMAREMGREEERESKRILAAVLANEKQSSALVRQLSDLGISSESAGKGTFELSSDGEQTLVPVASTELAVERRFALAPAVSPSAFETGIVTNTSSDAVLPGETVLIRDGHVIGRTSIGLLQKGHRFELELGPTDRVTAARTLDRAASRLTRAAGRTRLTLTYRIAIAGADAATAPIEVRDQVPVATDKAVNVTLLQMQPRADVSEQGIIEWALEKGANSATPLSYTFRVDYPSDRVPPALAPLEKLLSDELAAR